MSEDLDTEELEEAAEDLRSTLMGIGFTSDEVASIPSLLVLSKEMVERYEALRVAMEDSAKAMESLNKTIQDEMISLGDEAVTVSGNLWRALDEN